VALVVCTVLAVEHVAGQAIPIGIIDIYGLNGLSADRARGALTFREGDTVSFTADEPPAFIAASEARLATLPEVQRARINLVCCDNGRAIVHVGIEARGSEMMSFRREPDEDVRLGADIIGAGDEFSKALIVAVQRGDATEDRTQGYALSHDHPLQRSVTDRELARGPADT